MKSGIYQIVNNINNKRYIGSSNNIIRRFSGHRYCFKKGQRGNAHLRNAWRKYGSENFKFEILEHCQIYELAVREQYYIDKYLPKELYNKRKDATNNTGNKLGPLSDERKAKLKGRIAWNKGLKFPNTPNSGSFKKGLTSWNKGKKTNISWNRGKKGLQKAWNKGMKGWHPEGAGVQPKPFSIVSPDLVLYEGNSIKKFAKEMGFTTGIYVLINKKSEYYKGWRLPKETDNYNGYASFPN